MKLYNKNTLIWIIVILLVANLTTIGSIIYHAYFQQNISQITQEKQIEIPNSHLGRFFRDELNLTKEQHQQFRKLRQKFHVEANVKTAKMQVKRNEIMLELGKEKSDTIYLNGLAKDIGDLHEELKHLTFDYYLDMKSICDEEQKGKLFQVFSAMTNNGNEMQMPSNEQNNFNK